MFRSLLVKLFLFDFEHGSKSTNHSRFNHHPIPIPCSIADELLNSNRSEAIAKTTLVQKYKIPSHLTSLKKHNINVTTLPYRSEKKSIIVSQFIPQISPRKNNK